MNISSFHKMTSNVFANCELSEELFTKDSIIYQEGEELSFIRFIVKGEVIVLKAKKQVWRGYKNEFLGLTSFFNKNTTYCNSALTASETSIIKIKKVDFENALSQSKKLNNAIIRILLERIKHTSDYSKDAEHLIKKRILSL